MNIVEEFEKIIKDGKEKELIEFLKTKPQKKRAFLLPIAKNLLERLNYIAKNESNKYILKQKNIRFENNIKPIIEDIKDDIISPVRLQFQKKLIELSLLICSENSKDIISFEYCTYRALQSFDKYNISSWCFPEFFCNTPYITDSDYTKLLKCMQLKKSTYSNQEIANSLAQTTFTHIKEIQDITLREHIWYLFEYETVIHNYHDGEGDYWIKTLIQLSSEDQIKRTKVIEEALLSVSRFTNRAITGYFFKMLEILTPTDKELLELQDTLFIVLQSQHSKPINQTLKYLKRIHKEPSFDLEGFMEQVPLLLSWSVKAVVNATLGLIDVLIKAYPTHKEALGILATQALAQEDESLQTKTIKLLAKHKLLETQSILDEITIYADGLYHSTKQLLPELEEVTTQEETIEITPPQYIREDNRIIYPESFDEMVFFFSQVFEGNNVYDFDLFISLLSQLKKNVNKDNIDKLTPIFSIAEKAYTLQISNDNSNTISSVIPIMASSFFKFISNFKPIFSDKLKKLYSKSQLLNTPLGEDDYCAIFNNVYTTSKTSRIESVHAKLLFLVVAKNADLPLLSTPTHLPSWIEDKVLFNRLKLHHSKEHSINLYDFQIALARVVVNDNTSYIFNNFTGEIKNLLEYLFTDIPLVITHISTPEWWIVPILRKATDNDANLFTQKFLDTAEKGQHILNSPTWEAYRTPWEYETWEKGLKVKKTVMQSKFKIQRNHTITNMPFDSIFKRSYTKYHYDMISKYDTTSFLLFLPTLPHFLLENILKLIANSYESNYVKRTVEGVMKTLIDVWDNFNESSYLFVAYILISEEKVARTLASELWHKATLEGTMNHQLLGEILGKLEHNEYAPLKRFTDLVISNMLNLSTLHNQGLHTLLSAMIAKMNDEPIKGTKKLLEIYLEVLSLTEIDIPSETMGKLEAWGEVKSLKSVMKKIKG